jgi:glycosyltransferase involved in cell wall biosynthesis
MLSVSLRNKFSLVIVGGKGWGNVNLTNMIESLNVTSNVKVLRKVHDDELQLLYHNATLLVMPSLYEGFGLPLLEAMNAGVPILTSNVSSMPEIAKDSALYIDPYSVESISTGITNMLMSNKLRDTMSKYGLARAKQFSWESASQETINVFEKAISSREV